MWVEISEPVSPAQSPPTSIACDEQRCFFDGKIRCADTGDVPVGAKADKLSCGQGSESVFTLNNISQNLTEPTMEW